MKLNLFTLKVHGYEDEGFGVFLNQLNIILVSLQLNFKNTLLIKNNKIFEFLELTTQYLRKTMKVLLK